MQTRRGFFAAAAGLAAARGAEDPLPPVRAITRGPKFHWFGYYDKLQFDPANRYALGMEVDFEHRSPRPDDSIALGIIDLRDGDRWIELGRTRAWNWQQGAMLQWLPGSKSEAIWNDREDGRFVSRIMDVHTRKQRTLPAPVYAVSPDARWAVAPDFRRLGDMRPGYGYNGIPDPNKDIAAPDDAGIWHVDLRTGKSRLVVSIADVVKVANPRFDTRNGKHWFNHLLVSPDGRRFIFLHRWRAPATGDRFMTRMFTADPDGKNLHVVDDYGYMSHFIWRDERHILGWAKRTPLGDRFYLYQDRADKVEVVGEGVMTVNGHCTYLPGKRWILNDTYPDKQRMQNPYLFDTASGARRWLGHFQSPKEYTGEWRCDTHPRMSRDGRLVTVDSPHGGNGRQIYLIDIGGVRELEGDANPG